MPEATHRKILNALQTVESLYHRLIFVVGPGGSGKTAALQSLSGELKLDILNVNAELSKLLLDMTAKQRALQVPKLIDRITASAGMIVLFDNLELLFDVELKQNPLQLLQKLSRNRTIVAAWNGKVKDGKLIYAEAGHPEYRSYDAKDLTIVTTTDEHG